MWSAVLASSIPNAAAAAVPPTVPLAVGHGVVAATSASASATAAEDIGAFPKYVLSASGDVGAIPKFVLTASAPKVPFVAAPNDFFAPRAAALADAADIARAPTSPTLRTAATAEESISAGKAGATSAEMAQGTRHCVTRVNWPRLLFFAMIWAVIVAVVVGGISFLFQPLLTSQDRALNPAVPKWQWRIPLYNAVLAGTLTFALTTALGAVQR
jgi:hypothetical protein